MVDCSGEELVGWGRLVFFVCAVWDVSVGC